MAVPESLPDLWKAGISEDVSDDNEDDDSWREMEAETESLICLFCPKPFKTMAVALEHFKAEHSLDLVALKTRFNMDFYSYICLINYIRSCGVAPQAIAAATAPVWNQEKYLEPVVPADPWLMFDFEGLELPMESRPSSPEVLQISDGMVTLTEDSYAQLKGTIASLRCLIEQQNGTLAQAAEDISKMQQATQKIVSGMDDESLNIGKLRITEDFSYFNSYSHFGIHHTMLSDKPRTISYRDAILKNAEVLAGKTALDVGCGSAILSLFCAQAGAAKVIGVDQSDIIYHAMDIIRENGMEKRVELLKGRIEEVALPVDRVDVIISEWMGYFLLFEGMLDAVIAARDKYLKPGGILLPNRCSISLVGLSDPESYQHHVEFWSDVYGYKMPSLRKEVIREAFCTSVTAEPVATSTATVLHLDLATCSTKSTIFTEDFNLECQRDCNLTAICGYFDTFFDLPYPVVLSTSPSAEKTHWGQTIFFLPQPLPVTQGMNIPGKISCGRRTHDQRSLAIELTLGNQKASYYVG